LFLSAFFGGVLFCAGFDFLAGVFFEVVDFFLLFFLVAICAV